LGKAQGFASGFARIKARMTYEQSSDHGGFARMMLSLCDYYIIDVFIF
jgi:hypothetical protein